MFELWVEIMILIWVISISYDIKKLRRDMRRSITVRVEKIVTEEIIETEEKEVK